VAAGLEGRDALVQIAGHFEPARGRVAALDALVGERQALAQVAARDRNLAGDRAQLDAIDRVVSKAERGHTSARVVDRTHTAEARRTRSRIHLGEGHGLGQPGS